MKKDLLTKRGIFEAVENIKDELYELDTDQHPKFYRNESRGKKRTAFLLLKLNSMEKILAKIRR